MVCIILSVVCNLRIKMDRCKNMPDVFTIRHTYGNNLTTNYLPHSKCDWLTPTCAMMRSTTVIMASFKKISKVKKSLLEQKNKSLIKESSR